MVRRGPNLHVEQLGIDSAFLHLKGEGDLDAGIGLDGSLDLSAFQAQFKDLIDFQTIQLAGVGKFHAEYQRREGRFKGVAITELRDLNVAGLTSTPIQRHMLTIQSMANGVCDASGVPQNVADLKLGLAAGPEQIGAYATAARRNDRADLALTLAAVGPLSLSDVSAGAVVTRGDVKFQGALRNNGGFLEIGDLRLKLHAAGAAAGEPGAGAIGPGLV